jgi:hypothetical protein
MNKTIRQKLEYRVLTRREFFARPFRRITRKSVSLDQGEPVFFRIPLSDLKNIPEADLMCMTPVLRQGWTACICEAGIAYRGESGQEGIVSLEQECCVAVRFFDGTRTLGQVAAALDTEMDITPGRSASIVREAFLTLAEHEVYHPNVLLGPLPMLPPSEDQHA